MARKVKSRGKKRKYFLGGLMKSIAGATPIGMAMKALKKKKGGGDSGGGGKLGVGKVLKIKVIGEEGGAQGESQGEAMSKLGQDEAVAGKEASQSKGGGGAISGAVSSLVAKKGAIVKKRNYKKRNYVKDDKNADKVYEDIYKKEGRVTPHYRNQKEIEENLKKDLALHEKKFKTLSAVNKSGKQDPSKAKSNKEAFAIARNMGMKTYKYKGKTYTTRYAEETVEQFEKSHIVGTPEYKARIKDINKRKKIGRGVATPGGGDINYINPDVKFSNRKKKRKFVGGGTFHSYDSKNARKNVDRSNKPRTFNWKGYFKGEQGYFPDIRGKTTKQTVDENKDQVQKYADYVSYVPGPVGKGAGLVSAGIDSYDAYNAYQRGDMDTYYAERNKAMTTAMLSGTGAGSLVKTPVKQLTKKTIQKTTPKVGSKTAEVIGKGTGQTVKQEVKDTVKDKTSSDEFINRKYGNKANPAGDIVEPSGGSRKFVSNRGNWQGTHSTNWQGPGTTKKSAQPAPDVDFESKNKKIVQDVEQKDTKTMKEAKDVSIKKETPKAKKGAVVRKPNAGKTLEYDFLSGAGVLYDKKGSAKMKRLLRDKEEKLYRMTGKKPPKRNVFNEGAVLNEMNDKEGYKDWKDNTSTRTETHISPKVDRKSKVTKHYEETVDPDSPKANRKAKYVENRNLKGTTVEPGNQELLLEAKKGHLRGDIKKKGPFRNLVNRKTEKGVVKKKYDDAIYEDSEVIPGARADKFDYYDRKEEKDVGREQRKYVQSGSDSEGDPIKTKVKIKGIKGRDIPTEKHKEKMINENERKYVSVVDGKRVKKRGSDERTAREYRRKGFRRVYVEPDAEGNVQYVGSGKRATRIADRESSREEKRNRRAENKSIREQRREERKSKRKQNRQEFRESLRDPGSQSESQQYYKKGGRVRKYCM